MKRNAKDRLFVKRPVLFCFWAGVSCADLENGSISQVDCRLEFFLKHPCHSSQLTSEDETAQAILSILNLRIATNPNDMSRPISETENFGMNPKSVDPTGKF